MRKIFFLIVFVGFLFLLVSTSFLVLFYFLSSSSPTNDLRIAVYDNNSFRSVPGSTVEVYDLERQLLFSETADEKGVVSFSLSPGEYFISARRDGYEEKWVNVVAGSGTEFIDISLRRLDSCIEEWNCTSWSDCFNGIRIRKCVDEADCGSFHLMPVEKQGCFEMDCVSGLDCSDGNDCTADICLNNSLCVNSPVSRCFGGDGCCPGGCNKIIDSDCEGGSDSCFGDFQCDDGDSCTLDSCEGEPKECVNTRITECLNGDGCCPSDCDVLRDTDCASSCLRNRDCDDGNPCTLDLCVNGFCNVSSSPDGVSCGNGVCCFGECTQIECSVNSDCGVDDECISWTCVNAGKCGAMCVKDEVTGCVDDDGCCPSGCDESDDSDCIVCSNECSEGPGVCSGNRLKVCGNFDSDNCFEWGYEDCGGCDCSCGDYTAEDNEALVSCSDGIDNDCDGSTDEEDDDCSGCRNVGESCDVDDDCCNGQCDETGVCFDCSDCSGYPRCNSEFTGQCEEECDASPECDENSVDSSWVEGAYCHSCKDCFHKSDNTVDDCLCTSNNCVQGFCEKGRTCYYDVSCTYNQEWFSNGTCSTKDTCGETLLVIKKSCTASGCGPGEQKICDKNHACSGPSKERCDGKDFYCTSEDGSSWAWTLYEDLPEENCGDKVDNDCNGLRDCDDPACACGANVFCDDACVEEGCSRGECGAMVTVLCPPNCQTSMECRSNSAQANQLCVDEGFSSCVCFT